MALLLLNRDHQKLVTTVRKELQVRGVRCWMDIDGGMQTDIYDSMAQGVQGAACVICFMSQKYQMSENCKLELKFAKQIGVPIVPVIVGNTDWRPSDWLGIITAGALWVSLDDEIVTQNIDNVVTQIQAAVGVETEIFDNIRFD